MISLNDLLNVVSSFLDMLGEFMREWIQYLDDMNVGLNIAVRLIMIAVSLLVISFLFKRMLRSEIKESAFLMWALPAALLFVYGVWPELTYYIADMTHMAYGYALVVTVPFIALLYFIAFRYMCQIAELTSKVVELGSVVSLQRKEIAELKKRIDEISVDSTQIDEAEKAKDEITAASADANAAQLGDMTDTAENVEVIVR